MLNQTTGETCPCECGTARRGEPTPLGGASPPRAPGRGARPRRWPVRLTSALLGATLAACGGGGGGSGGGNGGPPRPVPTNEIGRYVDALPSWNEYAPRVETGDILDGDVTSEEVLVKEAPASEEASAADVAGGEDVIYECTTTPREISANPEELVIFSPDREVLYPGALIQGRSHRNGIGGLLPLNVDERAPISVSIPALPTGENFRTVAPRQAQVESAIGEMIRDATRDDLRTPSTVSFNLEEFNSEEQFALSAGLSGRYLGFSGRAEGSIQRDITESTVSLHYIERMYEVVYQAPNLPEQFFSEDFTQDVLDRYIERDQIGPNNLPVYVASVAYGRMLMFTVTSSASAQELRATLQAAYNKGIGQVEAELDVRQKSILRNSKISIASWGGAADNVAAVIRSGDWSAYFDEPAPLSTAQPLSYTLKNLGDSSIASVGETTEYNIRECTARGSAGDTFSFRSVQEETLRVPTPAVSHVGDFTGDGQEDLLWTHLGGSNVHAVAASNGDGTFDFLDTATLDESPPEGWGTYRAHVGDFNNDLMDDIAFVHLGQRNVVYLAYSDGDGTFRYSDRLVHVQEDGGWARYRTLVGNFDGQYGDDLVFNRLNPDNDVHLSVSLPEGDISRDTRYQQRGTGTTWGRYTPYVANIDGDNHDDLLWLLLSDTEHEIRTTRFKGATTGNLFDAFLDRRASIGWGDYETVIADIDGKNGADMLFVAVDRDPVPVHRNVALSGTRSYAKPDAQFLPRPEAFGAGGGAEVSTLDVNADGRDDLLLSDRTSNLLHLYVALGQPDGDLLIGTLPVQTAPFRDSWATFISHALDVDGDGDEDLVYTSDSTSLRLYVGIARGGNS